METGNKKNKNILYGLIVVLVAIIFLLFGFIIGHTDLFNNNQNSQGNTENTENESKITELSIESELVKKLANKVIGVYTNKRMSHYNNYFYKKDKIDITNEEVQFKLSLAAESVKDKFQLDGKEGYQNCGTSFICSTSYIDENTIKNAYYELYGKNSDYKRSQFYVDSFPVYNWSDENNRYECNILGVQGGAWIGGTISKLGYAKQVVSSEIEKIELYEYFASVISDVDNDLESKIYSDYDNTNLISSEKIKSNDDFFNEYADKVGVYKYTFIKDSNGTYIFTSVEKVK